MSRTLVGTTASGVAADVTQPGYLVELAFSATVRLSTRGTLNWNSQVWTSFDVRVGGLGLDGSASSQSGNLTFGNADLTMSAYILAEGVAGIGVRIWKFYTDSPGAFDPVQVFDGVADQATITDDGAAAISLEQAARTVYCPRTFMTPANGFNWLPADGQTVAWGDEIIRLTPEGY